LSVHLYCLRAAGDPPPRGVRGIDDAPVRLVEEPGLGAWVSASPAGAADVMRAAAHHRVISDALRTGTPVPARYGTTFADDAELIETLVSRAEEFRAALERVRGCVEVGVTVLWPEHAPRTAEPARRRAPASGRAFLEERRSLLAGDRARAERAERLLREVETALDVAAPVVRAVLPRAAVAGTLAYLVPGETAQSVLGRARDVRVPPPATLRAVGPWPPYSFV
jgi:hypothetical protein